MVSADPRKSSNLKAVMAMQTIFMIVRCASSRFLLWCLKGFTRARKQGRKTAGLFVRVDNDLRGSTDNDIRRNRNTISVHHRWLQLTQLAAAPVPTGASRKLKREFFTGSSISIA
jgi:hypothetical protein